MCIFIFIELEHIYIYTIIYMFTFIYLDVICNRFIFADCGSLIHLKLSAIPCRAGQGHFAAMVTAEKSSYVGI